jgi:tRNA-2-methylthio-N6-dimethylallyladenosine synthase
MTSFYIETFGCQMNVHDSEKIASTLEARGYRRVETVAAAELVLYNTCSIRDKAEQKVYHRLNEHKREHGKVFGVLGCVAQQEGERIFERAPQVRLVAGSASYSRLNELLDRVERGEQHVSGLSLDTDATFETESTRLRPPTRAATIRTGPTSRLSKVAIRSALTAWCRLRADLSAAAPVRR